MSWYNYASSGSFVNTNFVYKNANHITLNENVNRNIAICMNGNTPSVTLNADGTVTFHEAFTINEVAKFFWEGLVHCNPMRGEVDRLKEENATLRRRLSESEVREPVDR